MPSTCSALYAVRAKCEIKSLKKLIDNVGDLRYNARMMNLQQLIDVLQRIYDEGGAIVGTSTVDVIVTGTTIITATIDEVDVDDDGNVILICKRNR